MYDCIRQVPQRNRIDRMCVAPFGINGDSLDGLIQHGVGSPTRTGETGNLDAVQSEKLDVSAFPV